MQRISYINGAFVPHEKAFIHIEDRGNVFADGVYEVIAFDKGVFIDSEQHIRRLERSLKEVRIPYKVTAKDLEYTLHELIKQNKMQQGMVYMQVSRGVAKRDHAFPRETIPTVIMTVSPLPASSPMLYEKGVDIITHPDIRWGRCDIKAIGLLANVLAKQKAVEANAAEALFVNDNGIVTECSASNFYIIDDAGAVRTHPATHAILDGVTRQGVLKVARTGNIKVTEEPFTLKDAQQAKEAFITSTTKRILPVTTLDSRKIGTGKPGEITQQLMRLYNEYVEQRITK